MRKMLKRIVKVLDGKPRGRKGQSLVELALTAPIMVFMIMALTEVGFAANNYLVLMDLVREAGRRGANLNVAQWDEDDTRNFERMDCDTKPGYYDIGTLTGGRRVPRGLNFNLNNVAYGYKGYPYDAAANAALESKTFGFYDGIICQALLSMSPLSFETAQAWGGVNGDIAPTKDYGTALGNPPPDYQSINAIEFSRNDIVVSAISYAKMDFRDRDAAGNPIGVGTIMPNPTPINRLLKPTSVSINPDYSKLPATRVKVVVTGRFPRVNRFCGKLNGSTWVGDERDPFNYKRSEVYSLWSSTTMPDVDEVGYNPNPLLATPLLDERLGSQNIRGFIFTGGSVNDTPTDDGCYGSKFTVQRLENMLNTQFSDDAIAAKTPNGGMVIVEMFWQHHPFFIGPFLRLIGSDKPLWEGSTTDPRYDPVLYVYALFPTGGAEPTATP